MATSAASTPPRRPDLKLIGSQVQATATDLSSQVASLKAKGVKAILLTTTPTQTASVVGVDASIGLNVPVLGNNPTFVPQLLATPAGPALEQLFYLAASWDTYAGTSPGATKVRTEYKPRSIARRTCRTVGSTWGYGAAQAYATVLKKAVTTRI